LQDIVHSLDTYKQGIKGRRRELLLSDSVFFGDEAGETKVLRSLWKKGVEVHQERGGKTRISKPKTLFSIASSEISKFPHLHSFITILSTILEFDFFFIFVRINFQTIEIY